VWPAGVVGSLTHCAGYRAGVVARAAAVPVLGLDAEPARPLPEEVLTVVALPEELGRLRRLAAGDPGTRGPVAVLRQGSDLQGVAPADRRWLDFLDVRVDIRPHGTLTADVLLPGPGVDGVPPGGFPVADWPAMAYS
jgi:4'-phosphopantetheinyl transferase EntD